MNVFFAPDYRKGNSYQRKISDNLEKSDIKVTYLSPNQKKMRTQLLGIVKEKDIFHLHWTHSYIIGKSLIDSIALSVLFIVTLFRLKFRTVKIVWTVHNLCNHEKKYVWLDRLVSRIVGYMADQIIVHDRYAFDKVKKIFRIKKTKLNIIAHGHYIDDFDHSISKENARILLNLKEKDTCFLLFGNIRYYKRADLLINAFRKCSVSNKKLIIAGKTNDPNLKKSLSLLAKGFESVILKLEFIPDDQAPHYFKACDVVVLPYSDILTSGALLLAMSFAKPVIIPKIGSLPDFVGDEGGIIFETNNVDSLTQALNNSENIDLDKAGKRNYIKVKKLDWESIAETTLNVYKKE